jgi:hypothetical protein
MANKNYPGFPQNISTILKFLKSNRGGYFVGRLNLQENSKTIFYERFPVAV